MQQGARRSTVEPDELLRLRADLYRPSPPPGAVERYVALLGEQPAADASPGPVADPPAPRRRRRRLVAGGLVGAVLTAVLAAAALLPRAAQDPAEAEALVTGGPSAIADRDALRAMLDPQRTDAGLVARAVRGSGLHQLDVWDAQQAAAWVQQGRGPLARRFDGQRTPTRGTRPLSIVLQCGEAARYRWTVTGSAPGRAGVHVLATGWSADCGRTPTVATAALPAGAVVRGFDLAVAPGVRWAMALVHPVRVD